MSILILHAPRRGRATALYDARDDPGVRSRAPGIEWRGGGGTTEARTVLRSYGGSCAARSLQAMGRSRVVVEVHETGERARQPASGARLGRRKSGAGDGSAAGDCVVVDLDRAWLPERWTTVDGGDPGAGRSWRPNWRSSAHAARTHESVPAPGSRYPGYGARGLRSCGGTA